MYQTADNFEIANSSNKFFADFQHAGSLLNNISKDKKGPNISNAVKDNTYLKENNNRVSNLMLGSKRKANDLSPSTSTTLNETKKIKKPKFSLLPVISITNKAQKQTKTNNLQDNLQKPQSKKDIGKKHNLVMITGNIDFALKIHKTFADITALYEVFGKIIKISEGKHICEKAILLRSSTGPVLQGFFYEIDMKIVEISVGNIVCCIGKIIGFNKIQIFKIKVIPSFPADESIARFQNICNFTLNKLK